MATRVLQRTTTLVDGFKTYEGGLRFTHQVGARIQGTGSVSYTVVKADLPGIPENKGLGYAFDMTFRATGRMQFHGSFARSAGVSNRTQATYSINKTYGGDVTYQLGPRLVLNGGARYSVKDYAQSSLAGIPGLAHEDSTRYYGTARFDLSPRFSLAVDGFHNQRRANLSAFTYSDNRVSLSLFTHL